MVFYRVQVRSSKVNLLEPERNIKIDMKLSEIPGKTEGFSIGV